HNLAYHTHVHSLLYTPPPTTPIYTLSLHDALPISVGGLGDPVRDPELVPLPGRARRVGESHRVGLHLGAGEQFDPAEHAQHQGGDRKSTRLNSSHLGISYAVFCLKKKRNNINQTVL